MKINCYIIPAIGKYFKPWSNESASSRKWSQVDASWTWVETRFLASTRKSQKTILRQTILYFIG